MKRFAFFAVLLVLLLLCSCGKADIIIRTDMSGAKTTDYPAETTTEAVFETDESGNISAVLNKSSGVFHLSQDCYHAKRMKEENRQIIKAADIGDFIGKGYKPCGVCSAKYFDKETSEDDK